MSTPTMVDLPLWRNRARIVAYIDLVLSSLALIATVLFVVFGAVATATIVTHRDEIKEGLKKDDIPAGSLTVVMVVIWIAVAIMAIISAIEMWAVIMLLKATNGEQSDHKLALDRARIWRNVNIVFLIFKIFYYGGNILLILLVLEILFRGILLYVVCKFISAVEIAARTPSYGFPPDSVMIKH